MENVLEFLYKFDHLTKNQRIFRANKVQNSRRLPPKILKIRGHLDLRGDCPSLETPLIEMQFFISVPFHLDSIFAICFFYFHHFNEIFYFNFQIVNLMTEPVALFSIFLWWYLMFTFSMLYTTCLPLFLSKKKKKKNKQT